MIQRRISEEDVADVLANGEVEPKTATFTVERHGHAFMLRNVPARVCRQCGEPYFAADVTRQVLNQVDQASLSSADLAVLQFHAA